MSMKASRVLYDWGGMEFGANPIATVVAGLHSQPWNPQFESEIKRLYMENGRRMLTLNETCAVMYRVRKDWEDADELARALDCASDVHRVDEPWMYR